MNGGANGSLHRSIRQDIEWLAVTGDAVHGRIRGMPLREAQHAAERLFPEFERDVRIIGRVAASPVQLRGSARAPLITPQTLRLAGIKPLWQLHDAAERRADRAITERMEAWAAKHRVHAGGGR
jgi:hypothetical protein